mmetsp:Transcript_28532/g.27505  ORF Transcript_28532/g.27505 Transcript_28532/m.27505 type:complete len:202 (+) Transcript_28532:178-783(+)
MYGFIPLLDHFLPLDHYNMPPNIQKKFEKDFRFNIPLYLCFVTDYVTYIWMFFKMQEPQIQNNLGIFIVYFLAFCQTGQVNGVIGHELIHRKETFHKVLGYLTFIKVNFTHYIIQHIGGHHKDVCKPEDSSSAPMNEGLLYFWTKCHFKTYKQAWEVESRILKKAKLKIWSLNNRVIVFASLHMVVYGIVYYFFGWQGVWL